MSDLPGGSSLRPTIIREIRRGVAALVTVSAVLSAGCGGQAGHSDTRTLSAAHHPEMALNVQTDNGSVSVACGSGSDVTVFASVRATTKARLEATEVVVQRDEEGTLVLRVAWPGARQQGEGCSFDITLPDAAGAWLQTSNGSIAISGVTGDSTLTTSNGSVTIRDHAGPVTARTSNGSLTIERCAGPTDATTSNGRIRTTDMGSSVKARSSNGSVTIIQRPDATGPIEVATSNGSVDLTLGPSFMGRLTARTSAGEVRLFPGPSGVVSMSSRSSGELVIGEPGGNHQVSTVKTSNGSITVTSKGRG